MVRPRYWNQTLGQALSNGVYLIEDYPRYGLAPGTNDTLSNTSRKVLLAASVHGRRRACVFADTTPTEVLVVLFPEHSSTPRGCRKGLRFRDTGGF